MIFIIGAQTGGGDPLNRGCFQVYQTDIGLVINFKITCFQRHPAGPKPMVFGNEFFGQYRILDALADFVGNKRRDGGIGLGVG